MTRRRRDKYEGPWKLNRRTGEWRRRLRNPLVEELPLPPRNANPFGSVAMVGFIVHYADQVVKLPRDGESGR